ncbi:hypothetical protein QAD02_020512 [Eretmocerus hayati]|uniref:Uncharacterized protein n=1 Tax=Eretmocerus hayati TaxID=131215 RepID=A0ACC2PN51_9HYME|nr:hypothetical protein QAD02_020512 [Eretmocerus hayati]
MGFLGLILRIQIEMGKPKMEHQRQKILIRRLQQRAKKRSAVNPEKMGLAGVDDQEQLAQAMSEAAVAQREAEILRTQSAEAEAKAARARAEQLKTISIHNKVALKMLESSESP